MISSFLLVTLFLNLCAVSTLHAKILPVVENEFCMPPSPELIERAEHAAEIMNFTQDYFLYTSKKRAIQANPANKFLALGFLPATKQPFIMLNEQWFAGLSEDEQLFLLARSFTQLTHGITARSVQVMQLVPLVMAAMVVPVYYSLRKTPLADYNFLIKFVASQLVIAAAQKGIQKPYCWLFNIMQEAYEIGLNRLVIERTANKEAARNALEYFDDSIKREIAAGDSSWLPLQNRFAHLAQNI